MGSFFDSLKNKRFRYGTFSTAMMLFAIALFVLLNLVAGEFDVSRDLTDDQIFSLSRPSRDFLAGLDQDVTIFYLTPTGSEIPQISQLLVDYASASSRVQVEHRDPLLNPTFVHSFPSEMTAGIPVHSVIVQGDSGYRVVRPEDMTTVEWDWSIFAQVTRSINIEREITRAIHSVTELETTVIYYVRGSGELELAPELISQLATEHFEIRQFNAVIEEVPEDADILLITMPTRDWTPYKAERVLAYLEDEGRAFIALSPTPNYFPNFSSVMAAFGVGMGDYLVLEGDMRHIFGWHSHQLLSDYTAHPITQPLIEENFLSLLAGSTGIELLDIRRTSLEIETLISTSRDAFGRSNPEIQTPLQTPEDVPGPFNLAVAIDNSVFFDRMHTTQLVIVGSLSILDEDVNNAIGGSNWEFVSSSLRWLQGLPPTLFIPVRTPPGAVPLMINQFQSYVMAGTATGILPLACVGLGFFIWFRRRHS